MVGRPAIVQMGKKGLTLFLIFLVLISCIDMVSGEPDLLYGADETIDSQPIESKNDLDSNNEIEGGEADASPVDEIEYINKDERATVGLVYSLLGENVENQEPVTVKILAGILVDRLNISYPNYEYYRSVIKDSANRNILKCYSEGILTTDHEGYIYPDKELTVKEVEEILARLESPMEVERPEYVYRANIPILMYHEINPLPKNGPSGLYVSPDNFIKQLEALQEQGYNTVTMEQVYQHWENQVPLPEKPIVLSFDDGYDSHYNFVSVELSKRGMAGTFYIITEKLAEATVKSPENLRNMYLEGMEIGSHTVTHADARYSTKTKIRKEYKESKEVLEGIIGNEIRHFCYPIGGTTDYAVQTLKELGYKTAVKTTYGKANKSQGLLTLKRIRIDYYDSIAGFLNKIR